MLCNVANGPPFLKIFLLDKLDVDHSDHPFFLPDKALTLSSTTLQKAGAGVVYFFIPTSPLTGTLLHYHSQLDQSEISQLMIDQRLPAPRPQQSSRGMAIGDVTLPLITAFQRLLALLREPNDIPVLAPMIQREIYYRLLVGDQGLRLRQMAAIESQNRQIARAIEWIKINFSHSIKIEELASQVGMSPSTFHHHFRMITAMSPLQYQKKLRLNEARRLMLSKRLDATTAAVQVGYESPSQFSREYRRLFGNSPLRDIRNLREMSTPQFVT